MNGVAARNVRCFLWFSNRPLMGMQMKYGPGLHTGECETIDGKVGGLAVVIGARIGAMASPSEVLVSQTVKDLVAGSGLVFADRGLIALRVSHESGDSTESLASN
jgi:class 3 adenylate cyclase